MLDGHALPGCGGAHGSSAPVDVTVLGMVLPVAGFFVVRRYEGAVGDELRAAANLTVLAVLATRDAAVVVV